MILDKLVTANAAIADPTVAITANETTASGCLAAGTYYVYYTWCDAYGESKVGTSGLQITASGKTSLTTITVPALATRAQSINVYIGPAGGAAGVASLFYTGLTTTTLALAGALTYPAIDQPGGTVPSENTTGAAAHSERLYSLLTQSPTEKVLERLSEDVSNVLSGYSMDIASIYRRMLSWKGILATWDQIMKEINTLLVSKLPSATINTGSSAIGLPLMRGWTLPTS